MIEKIKKIINTSTFRHTSLVTGATVINGLLGFIFYWLLARIWKFQPDYLGAFSVAVTAAGLFTDIFTVGTDTGVVNFVGRFIKKDKEKALRFLKVAFETKVVVSILVIIVGWFLIPSISSNILGKTELIVPLRFSLFIAASGLLFGFATSSLQALQKFSKWGFVNIFSNACRLILVYFLFLMGVLSVESGLAVYFAFPVFAFLITFLFLPNFIRVKNEGLVFKEFFKYNKWVGLFTIIAAISSRLDMFIVVKLKSLSDVGIYSVAVTLSGIVPQLVGAVGTVVAPKLAAYDTKEKTINYLKKLQLFVAGLSLLGIIAGTIIGYIFIRKFYAPIYFGSFIPFFVLLIAQAIFLFSIPVHMAVIYYFSYPKLFVLISMVNILIVSVLGWILVSSFGFVGASVGVLVGNVFNFIIPCIWVINKFRRDQK